MQSQAHWKPAPHLADLYREGGDAGTRSPEPGLGPLIPRAASSTPGGPLPPAGQHEAFSPRSTSSQGGAQGLLCPPAIGWWTYAEGKAS